MLQTFIHPSLGEITISSTRRARRISVSVRSGGRIRCSLPPWIPTKRAIEFIEENKDEIEQARQRIAAHYPNAERQEPDRREIEQLRQRAKEFLPAKVEELSRKTGLRCGKVSVRAARSRWGSCSTRNDISLSLFLMRLPEELIEFVIIHELCHTIHKNHSDKFHRLLDHHVGGREKELNAKLRKYRAL